MKVITAVFPPGRFDDVQSALAAFNIRGLTVTEVWDYGYGVGRREVYRGRVWVRGATPAIRIDLLVVDQDVDLARVIAVAAGDSGRSSSRVWVTPVEDVIRVRTGEHGEAAI